MNTIRKEKGFTQKELALITGISQSTISKIEKGYIKASINEASKITEALGVNIGDIFIVDKEVEGNAKLLTLKDHKIKRLRLSNRTGD